MEIETPAGRPAVGANVCLASGVTQQTMLCLIKMCATCVLIGPLCLFPVTCAFPSIFHREKDDDADFYTPSKCLSFPSENTGLIWNYHKDKKLCTKKRDKVQNRFSFISRGNKIPPVQM